MKCSLGVLLAFLGLFSSCSLSGLGRSEVERLVRPRRALAQTKSLSLSFLAPATLVAGSDGRDSSAGRSGGDGEALGDPLRPDEWDQTLFSETDVELPPEDQLTKKIGKLPGEFRHQAALLLGCRELLTVAPGVLVGIVEAACGRIPILALVSDDENRDLVLSTLEEHGLPADSVYFLDVPHNTMWIRDYGPVVTTALDGSEIVLNADYGDDERLEDDQVPAALARLLGALCVRVPFEMDGGNLLTNGEGLCLSTAQLLVDNDIPEARLRRMLRIYYGCEQTVFLEPLVGEETGHVDMFATFTSPDTVVLGEYDDEVDDENKQVLDRNLEKLSHVRTPRGRLDIVRMPMPARSLGQWRTYTNVIFANGTLLVPVYLGDDLDVRARALRTYSRLLPGWDIIALPADEVVGGGGSLHCVSRNVAFLGGFGLTPSECVAAGNRESDWLLEADFDPARGAAPGSSSPGHGASPFFRVESSQEAR